MVVDGTAHYGRDYTVTSTDVMMANGEQEKRVPIEIVDDRLSEVEETFTVRLIGPPTGGALLGQVTETLVTIKASDDPYGSFGKLRFRFGDSVLGAFGELLCHLG